MLIDTFSTCAVIKRVVSWMLLGLWLVTSAMIIQTRIAGAQTPTGDWSPPEDISAPDSDGLDLYGVLLCDPNQNLHILWGKGHNRGSDIYYRTDAGGTLSAPNAVLAASDPLALALSATITQQSSTLHVIWQNRYIRGDVLYSKAPLAQAGDARAWDKPRLMIPQVDSAGITSDTAGKLHLIYGASDPEGYKNAVYYMRSEDDGATWSEPNLVYEVQSEAPSYLITSMVIDATGRFHLGITIRTQTYGVYSELGYMRSLDGGQTWETYQVIAKQSESTPNVSVIAPFAFGADEIHLTWHDPRRMHMWSVDGGATWSSPIQIIDLGAGFGGANYLAKDSAGVLRAVTGVAGGVYVSTFSNGQWLAPERIEDRWMDPHSQSLVVCQGNQLHVVYDDRVVEDTTVWYSHKQVNAPQIERRPIPPSKAKALSPTVEPQSSSPAAEPAVGAPASANNERPLVSGDLASAAPSPNALTPLLISTASVIVLISGAMIWHRRRSP